VGFRGFSTLIVDRTSAKARLYTLTSGLAQPQTLVCTVMSSSCWSSLAELTLQHSRKFPNSGTLYKKFTGGTRTVLIGLFSAWMAVRKPTLQQLFVTFAAPILHAVTAFARRPKHNSVPKRSVCTVSASVARFACLLCPRQAMFWSPATGMSPSSPNIASRYGSSSLRRQLRLGLLVRQRLDWEMFTEVSSYLLYSKRLHCKLQIKHAQQVLPLVAKYGARILGAKPEPLAAKSPAKSTRRATADRLHKV
jgi:hypothetical protein